jgi:hypothetical protein
MPQTIDVTGLSPEAIRAVQNLVDVFRNTPTRPTTPPDYWPGPPPGETADEWIARIRAFAASRPRSDVIADDSRESIYDRSCE